MAIDTEERNPPKKNPDGSSSNKKLFIIIGCVVGGVIVLGIIVVIAIGFIFGKMAETVAETATDSEINISKDEVSIRGENGDKIEVGEQVALPDDFPQIVPIYENAQLRSAQTITGSDATSFTVVATSDDEMAQVEQFYTEALSKDKGWQQTGKTTTADLVRVNATNQKQRIGLILSITSDEDRTVITTIVQAKA